MDKPSFSNAKTPASAANKAVISVSRRSSVNLDERCWSIVAMSLTLVTLKNSAPVVSASRAHHLSPPMQDKTARSRFTVRV